LIDRLAEAGELNLRDLLAPYPRGRHQTLGLAVGWMCKLGLLDWR
jgi:hypothetical protein